jgi:hypothetical protein
MGSIVTANLQATGFPEESGYTLGFLLIAGVSIAAVIAALAVPSARRAPARRTLMATESA